MGETAKIQITSKLGLYIWRGIYSFIVFFLIIFLFFSLMAFISDVFTNTNKIYVNPHLSGGTVIGDRIATVLILALLTILLNWLIRILFRSRHFSINDIGIHFNNETINWDDVSRIAAYGGNGPIVVLKLRNYAKLKKIIGVLPVFSAKDRVNKISSFAKARGIEIKRWLI
jgi:hypothetical protein